MKVRVGGKTSEQKVFKKEDGGLARCHNEKRPACEEQMETKDRSEGREEMKMADYQTVYLRGLKRNHSERWQKNDTISLLTVILIQHQSKPCHKAQLS